MNLRDAKEYFSWQKRLKEEDEKNQKEMIKERIISLNLAQMEAVLSQYKKNVK